MDPTRLPRVDAVADALDASHPHALRVAAARVAIARAREGHMAQSFDGIVAEAGRWIARRDAPRLERVINATGVMIHTNLGRAPLPAEAIAQALGYCNVEYDLARGRRGSRRGLVEPLLCELSGAESALVVNNCAAALVLALATLRDAAGRPDPAVLVSRGELVEIGGSFRIPDILASTGVLLREVGTTNRTYAEDYRRALGPGAIALLRVHPSNFRVTGFVARPDLPELRAVADEAGLPLLVDLGSDALMPASSTTLAGLAGAPGADEDLAGALAAGADLVMFSGDKLLGGPQAGVVLGRRALLDRMAAHPLMRALRPDKLALAGLEWVLRARAVGAPERVPLLAMIHADPAALRARADRLAERLAARGLTGAEVVATDDPVGGGSHPETTLPGFGLALSGAADARQRALRAGRPPVVARVADGRLVIALRTVPEADEPDLERALLTSLDTPDPLI